MTKVTYTVDNEKFSTLAKAQAYAEKTGGKMTTTYEPIKETVHMVEKQRANRVVARPRV